MSTPTNTQGRKTAPPFPFHELARVLVIPLVAVGLFIFLYLNQAGEEVAADEDGLTRISLLQKDERFRPLPPEKGGATGSIWYTPSGPELKFQLRAEGLVPGKRYLLEIAVEDTIYTLASRSATMGGELAIDTTLTHFAEGVCVGPNYDPPRALAGPHAIRFWLKLDGNPRTGTGREHSPQFTEGQDLPCSGNGDGDYTYVLFENDVAHFTGSNPQSRSSTSKENPARGPEGPGASNS